MSERREYDQPQTGIDTVTTVDLQGTPAWLTAADEMAHPTEGVPATWAENYLTYVWSPANQVGIYAHLAKRPGAVDLWDEQVNIALPDGRYVTSKGFGPGAEGASSVAVCGARFTCHEPFRRWSKRFVGAGRVAGADEYRAGPATDGAHTPLAWSLDFVAMSPPYDFGEAKLDQEWGHGHYEQHGRLSGWLTVGQERFAIDGTGLRDHSWGPRDYRAIGTTTWIHAQFPDSGRGLMAVQVTGRPPKPPFTFAVVTDATSATAAVPSGIPAASALGETEDDYSLELDVESGGAVTVTAHILNALRAGLVGPAEIGLGTFDASQANHHYVDAFTRFEWDGEVGYGITERSVDLTTRESE